MLRSVQLLVGAVCIVALSAGQVSATDYYVNINRNGAGNGTGTLNDPFRYINQAGSIATAGSSVYIMGGTYRETITPAYSGSSGAPITFQPYNNQHVIVTGLDEGPSTGWTLNNGKYEYTYAGANLGMYGYTTNQLFIDGKPMDVSKSINSGYNNPLLQTFHTITNVAINGEVCTITDNAFASGNWTGANIAIRGGPTANGADDFFYGVTGLTHSGNTVTFNVPYSEPSYRPSVGNLFYLYGTKDAINSNKQYCYDGTKFYTDSSMNPNGKNVEVRTRIDGLILDGKSHINVSGIDFQAARVNVIGDHNSVANCRVYHALPVYASGLYSELASVRVLGNDNTVTDSEIAYSWGAGIHTKGDSNTIHNNVVHDNDYFGSAATSISIKDSTNSTVSQNTIYNSGASGMTINSDPNAIIENNDISRYGHLAKDISGVNSFNTHANGTEIRYNYIHGAVPDHDVYGGIYIDMDPDPGSSNYKIHHNVITDANEGIFAKGTDHTIYNNTLWNIGTRSVRAALPEGVEVYNNFSNNSEFGGNVVDHNTPLYTNPVDEFVGIAAGNYQLKSTSIAKDNGRGGTDLGAYQFNDPNPWTAGASFKTWLFADQTSAPLATAVAVTSAEIRTTAGSLIAGRTGDSVSTNNRSFFKFDLSGVSGSIQSAVVRIYENTAPTLTTGDVSLYAVTSSWNSETVSYNQSVAPTGTTFYDPDNLDLYTDVDVTSIVQGWIDDPSSNYGFSLRSDAEGMNYAAKYFEGMYGIAASQLIITVPEPGVLSLLAIAGLSLLGYLWKRGKCAP